MFKGYRINDICSFDITPFKPEIAKIKWESKRNKEKLMQTLFDSIVIDNNSCIINMNEITQKWFPQKKCHVFISHSHKDEDYALALSIMLKKNCGIDSFVDSSLWGLGDDFLKKIDGAFCKNKNGSYDYSKRNITTSQIHLVIITALTRMIANTECFLFLETENSIKSDNSLDSSITESPWLYSELLISEIIGKRSAKEHRRKAISEHYDIRAQQYIYSAKLDHLNSISISKIIETVNQVDDEYYGAEIITDAERFLNKLYKI